MMNKSDWTAFKVGGVLGLTFGLGFHLTEFIAYLLRFLG